MARSASVRRVPDGWPLGYGARCRAEGERTIAVVPVGYHDGFPRALSDACEVLVGGRRAQVVGAISMDLTLVDITGFHRGVGRYGSLGFRSMRNTRSGENPPA